LARHEIKIKDLELERAIQEYADLYCDGNFSMAFRQLAQKGLNNE
jgi:hypothetical protein